MWAVRGIILNVFLFAQPFVAIRAPYLRGHAAEFWRYLCAKIFIEFN